MDINVNVEKMDRFGEYVLEFKGNIHTACEKLREATKRLQANNTDMDDIVDQIDTIESIVSSAEPDLKSLNEAVQKYAAMVRRLKSVMNG